MKNPAAEITGYLNVKNYFFYSLANPVASRRGMRSLSRFKSAFQVCLIVVANVDQYDAIICNNKGKYDPEGVIYRYGKLIFKFTFELMQLEGRMKRVEFQ